ncbi:stage III sporulation protein AF [Carboxydothermus pertinax]|uniref:Stage III sporulation protein AF n=1 Tax=Carboxydothermus pertinax TaxID=870242 RepID=A0A1L8CU33_9THEO|nr:stage III sporulation protein AF [Carboxydothermus pertinax]GAV22374.1 stage III sporulation protein AF [Carboxydothermus pertinax]
METVLKLVREIIFLLLLFTFLELLLPLGQIKNFTRAVIGLLILLAIINPLFEVLNTNWELKVFLPQEEAVPVIRPGELYQRAKDEAEKGLEAQIKALLNLSSGKVEKVQVKFGDNRVEKVTVLIKGPFNAGEKERYREVLKAFFGIENIDFRVTGVGQ